MRKRKKIILNINKTITIICIFLLCTQVFRHTAVTPSMHIYVEDVFYNAKKYFSNNKRKTLRDLNKFRIKILKQKYIQETVLLFEVISKHRETFFFVTNANNTHSKQNLTK